MHGRIFLSRRSCKQTGVHEHTHRHLAAACGWRFAKRSQDAPIDIVEGWLIERYRSSYQCQASRNLLTSINRWRLCVCVLIHRFREQEVSSIYWGDISFRQPQNCLPKIHHNPFWGWWRNIRNMEWFSQGSEPSQTLIFFPVFVTAKWKHFLHHTQHLPPKHSPALSRLGDKSQHKETRR